MPTSVVPTTTGTAAEVTVNYVITDEGQWRKLIYVDPYGTPQVAFIDADMTDAVSPALKTATGVDALTHAIEGYLTRGTWTLTDTLHLKTIETIAGTLCGSVAGDADAGEAVALGQYAAGMGSSNVRLELVYDTVHSLGASYNTSHGVANVILLPHVMRFSAGATGEKYRDVARSIGVRMKTLSLATACQTTVGAVCQLNHDVSTPGYLREMGVEEEDIPALIQAALEGVYTGGNPRETSLAGIVGLYQTAW